MRRIRVVLFSRYRVRKERIRILRSHRRRARGLGSRAVDMRAGSRRRKVGADVVLSVDVEDDGTVSAKMELESRSPDPGDWVAGVDEGRAVEGLRLV